MLAINAIMFIAEFVFGLISGSVSLLADSLDMLGDTLVYGFSLFVVGRSLRWKARSALLKGSIMMLFSMIVLGQAVLRFLTGEVPDALLFGSIGIVALFANAICLYLLSAHRADDVNMRSTWVCSRNDIVANVGVIVAAALVYLTASMWPDLIVSLIITVVFVKTSLGVLADALNERRAIERGPCLRDVCPEGVCYCT